MWQRKCCLRYLKPSHMTATCDSTTKTLQLWRKVEEDGVEVLLFVQQQRTEKQTGNVAIAQNRCARATLPRNSDNIWQLQGTILALTNLFDIYVLNYIFLFSNVLSISLYKISWKLKNVNKSTVLTSLESVNWIMKKTSLDYNFKSKGTKCTLFHKSRKLFAL
jgi:hypothetical protein